MIKLADVFSNHMVLQRRKPVCIFGTNSSTQEVKVSLFKEDECIQTESAFPNNEEGLFDITLSPMEAMENLRLVVTSGDNTVEFHDVAIGEVWLAGGQSNMEYELKDATGGIEFMNSGNRPAVRFFYTPKLAFRDKRYDEEFDNATWQCFEGANASNWSAVGFWFAKELSEKLGVTVGVIGCNWGGTVAFNWMSRENLISDDLTKKYVEEYETSDSFKKSFEDQLKDFREYEERHAKWEFEASKIYEKEPFASFDSVQERVGKCEYPGPMNECNFTRPYGLYNMMLKKIIPYTLGGVIYYQGESDEVRPEAYEVLLTNLISEWRKDFRDSLLPFLVVQLPMHRYLHESEDSSWSIIRENQRRVSKLVGKVGLAVCIDCGEFHQIHPVEKRTVAHRLFLQAMNVAYGAIPNNEACGADIKSVSVQGNMVSIMLTDNNIVIKEDTEAIKNYVRCLMVHPKEARAYKENEKELNEDALYESVKAAAGFEIQDRDGNWYPAEEVLIDDYTIKVMTSKVDVPFAVRYLWKKYHSVFVFDKKGIPLAPFMKNAGDSWPRPPKVRHEGYYFDSFTNGEVLENKKTGRLPAMGWNSWNAFGSNNTEALTKAMADKMVELGLSELGYRYVVLDDGCYCPERNVEGQLVNEPVKFPNDFKVLSDYIHSKGLKFGMYNDIGTNLCAGASVGTCGHEDEDARSYVNWGVDFIKVDNCYYPWDNATFSDARNARFVYAPKVRSIKVVKDSLEIEIPATKAISSNFSSIDEDGYVTNIGTLDGTGPEQTPIGNESAELIFEVNVPFDGEYTLFIDYIVGQESGCGSWLQVKTDNDIIPSFDNFVSENGDTKILLTLKKGMNKIRLMNHRRQENTLLSYGRFKAALNKADPDNDILLSICEWGKTQPQNWGYKVGDSWRILNDITFRVGNDGDPGHGDWDAQYTTSITSQYNKAVIMDEFAGLNKGWNDPDMLMIGMEGLDETMNRTHMAMWCMMNSPLMLGLDLRRVSEGDSLWKIIANKDLIALNQDPLGMQAKRIKVYITKPMDENLQQPAFLEKLQPNTILVDNADTEYIRDNNRVDILVKVLSDSSIAVSFFNLSNKIMEGDFKISVDEILKALQEKHPSLKAYEGVTKLVVTDLWDGSEKEINDGFVRIGRILPHDNYIVRICL